MVTGSSTLFSNRSGIAKVAPALVARDLHGKPNAVRHEVVNVMLLNELLKKHREREHQASRVEGLESRVAALELEIGDENAGIEAIKREMKAEEAP